MATTAAAALLDELMGRARNLLPSERDKRLSWDSDEVCRFFLVKFCPHELFTNTKSDLGICEKIHDEELRKEFGESETRRRYHYEDEFIRYADNMLSDVDRRIEKGKQRLALSIQDALANSTTGDGKVDEQISLLSERITGLVNEAERLGSEGNVEEAQGLSKLCDKLREERDQLRKATENTVWHQAAEMAASQEKQMEVCEICGAFLIVGDAQQRIDDHLMGKQHMGFAKLREAIQEIKEIRDAREAKWETEREARRKLVDDDDKRKDKHRESRGPYQDRRGESRGDRDRDRDRDRNFRDDRDRYRGRDNFRGGDFRGNDNYRDRDRYHRDRDRRDRRY